MSTQVPGTYIKSWAWLYVTVSPELVMETGKSWEVPALLTQQIQWALGSVGNPGYNLESARSRPRVSLCDVCSAAPTLGPPHTPPPHRAPRKHTTQVNKDFVHYLRKLFPLLKESNRVTVFVSSTLSWLILVWSKDCNYSVNFCTYKWYHLCGICLKTIH